jgi:AraC-like DNA-binding protein
MPPIAVMRIDREHVARVASGSHAHDFPAVVFFERGGPTGMVGVPQVAAGDLFVIAPGDVLTIGTAEALAATGGWSVAFLPEAVAGIVPGALLSWLAHPLLCAFVRGASGGLVRLSVPTRERAEWIVRIRALEGELRARRDGFGEAALAHLVLLLVGVARLAGTDPPVGGDPLITAVFATIDSRYTEPLTLRDVARAVNLSAGHLTTTVRRRTGRTVGEWIIERRMAQARRLLTDTALSVEEVGRAVGIPDPSYFARQFRRTHGLSPRQWRHADQTAWTTPIPRAAPGHRVARLGGGQGPALSARHEIGSRRCHGATAGTSRPCRRSNRRRGRARPGRRPGSPVISREKDADQRRAGFEAAWEELSRQGSARFGGEVTASPVPARRPGW